MQRSIFLGSGTAVAAVLLSTGAFAGALSPAEAQQLGSGTTHPYIVIMKKRLTGADAINDQGPVINELRQVHATRIKQFSLVNSLAATVTKAEAEHLKTNGAVAMVAPDVVIYRPTRNSVTSSPANGTSLSPNVIPGACGPNGKVLLDPEALQTT